MIYLIGDTQSKENVKNPLVVIAHHICDLRPKHVLHLGDHWDMPSLSAYDKGKKSHRVYSYLKDIEAGNLAMREFWNIINLRWPKWKDECVFVILEGNHENRRNNALEYGGDYIYDLLASKSFDLKNWSIKVPFLEVIKINGIEFSHYFQNDGSPRPIGTAKQLLTKRHVSCIAGHKQGFDYAEMLKGADETIQSMIIGSSYYHNESYKTHTNHHWRGTVLIHFREGAAGFDFSRYSLESLDKIYDL